MTTAVKPTVDIDLRSISGSIITAIERDTTQRGDGAIWSTDGDTPERANGYTASGAVHILQAQDGTLWRLTIEQVDSTNPGDAVPPLRPMLTTHPAGWYVADGLRVIAGPFQVEAEAETVRRQAAGERTAAAYKYPNGAPMPIWTPTTYYWPGDTA